MEIKTLEIRDRGTFVPAIAIHPKSRHDGEKYLWARVGFVVGPHTAITDYILLGHLNDLKLEYDPNVWGNRTMHVAHKYLKENWAIVENGQVIDVEYILGETQTPKVSERVSNALKQVDTLMKGGKLHD